MASIKCFYCKNIHTSIADVKACSLNGNAKISEVFAAKVETGKIVETVIPATVKKVTVPAHRTSAAYLALKAKVAPAAPEVQMVQVPGLDISVPVTTAQVAEIAQSIATGTAASLVKTGQDIECGMYQTVHPETGAITIYKVKFNKAGTHKLAEKLSITGGYYGDKPKGKFWYAPGMMAKLTSENKMTEEQAKAFHDATKAKYGVDYGFCCVCGKLLTVKKSIDKGIGPVCETKF